jgi:hypothetical protein
MDANDALKAACARLQLFLDTHGDMGENFETQADIDDWLALSRSAWQPISTAPKDGTEIMVLNTHDDNHGYCTEKGQIGIAYWGKALSKERWCSTVCCDGVSYFEPTHWMPLPPLAETGE